MSGPGRGPVSSNYLCLVTPSNGGYALLPTVSLGTLDPRQLQPSNVQKASESAVLPLSWKHHLLERDTVAPWGPKARLLQDAADKLYPVIVDRSGEIRVPGPAFLKKLESVMGQNFPEEKAQAMHFNSAPMKANMKYEIAKKSAKAETLLGQTFVYLNVAIKAFASFEGRGPDAHWSPWRIDVENTVGQGR